MKSWATDLRILKLWIVILLFSGCLDILAVKASATLAEYKPVGPTQYRADGRRRLAPFQLCLLCKCCSASTCTSMPCCFGIDCQLPNKPFGVCAFVPKTCNCNSCAA
ncbi:hypothetical protein like AT5G01015 [Hibiscus trionum]|uniref:DUF7866 domain-containing protein n=1 Tax=Hibiscus trionum TaxID=183268 RepID=A0A9W7LGU8_HIBTR|nr:hypothetical protein like AT5G01015 [Hibiscus trionum]